MKWWKVSVGNSYNATDKEVNYRLDVNDRVVGIVEKENGNILIAEACDCYFSVECTRQEAIEIFKEMVSILEANQ